MKSKTLTLTVFLMVLAVGMSFAADKYSIDLAHSYAGFTVKHLVITNVKGNFTDFSGEINYDANDITKSSVNVTIKAASINTDNETRDNHLKSADFFDVEKFPEITFASTKIEKSGDSFTMHGNLTIHGVTKEVAIPFDMTGKITDPWGKERIAFEGSTKISRNDFGMTWNKAIETGGVVVGDEVKIELQVEAVKM